MLSYHLSTVSIPVIYPLSSVFTKEYKTKRYTYCPDDLSVIDVAVVVVSFCSVSLCFFIESYMLYTVFFFFLYILIGLE